MQPLEGVEKMEELRKSAMRTQLSSSKKLKLHQLGNGPSKLCQCLGITKCLLDQRDLVWLIFIFIILLPIKVVSVFWYYKMLARSI